MKVCVYSPIQAHSIRRITNALAAHVPAGVEVVASRDEADVVVHTLVGVQNFDTMPIDQLVAAEVARGQRYAMVQCCLASTENGRADFWQPLWSGAAAVWSYLPSVVDLIRSSNLLFRPLGADQAVFRRYATQARPITMLTTGYVAESEGIAEASDAVRRMGGWHVHVGPNLNFGDHVTSVMGISDADLASLYRRSKYVAGLRRCEGFELPAAEGLLCGARPIMFDAPHYRAWFNDWAVFVPEGDAERVTTHIHHILSQDAVAPVSTEESQAAAALFHWPTLVREFWEMVGIR